MLYFLRGIFCFLFFLAVIGILLGWYQLSGGFRLDKIEMTLPEKQIPIPSGEIQEILQQNFYYLDKGCQSYVFESQDQKYVLKIVRYRRYQEPFWMQLLQMTEKGKFWKKQREQFKEKMLHMTLSSFQIAFEEIPDLTHVLYAHINQTRNLSPSLCLKDRFQRTYVINPNNVAFVLQKKALSLSQQLTIFKQQEKYHEAAALVENFFVKQKLLLSKQIANTDYNCIKNSGWGQGEIFFTDVGSFIKDERLLEPKHYNYYLRYGSKRLGRWIQENFSSLAQTYEKCYQENKKVI